MKLYVLKNVKKKKENLYKSGNEASIQNSCHLPTILL